VVVLFLAGVYFLIPIYAGLKFSLQNIAGNFSFQAFENLPSAPGFSAALALSLKLAFVTIVLSTLLMVPTAIYVHLKLPRMRRIMDVVTMLPIVIPPIVLIAGVLGVYPLWLKSSPYLLSLMYVIFSMPFVYRSLDAGLGAIDLKTLTEASRSLGGSWIKTLWRVILPNIRPALISAMVLTLALVLGEYTMASLDLWTTIPVWIVQFQTSSDGHTQVAAAMLGLIATWVLLVLVVSLDRSHSRRSHKKRRRVP
jgi:putative spermidine/putrescine transport system permease protein